eukprot:scaffold123634_cov32-Tisochrysis_lutea.AAC.2
MEPSMPPMPLTGSYEKASESESWKSGTMSEKSLAHSFRIFCRILFTVAILSSLSPYLSGSMETASEGEAALSAHTAAAEPTWWKKPLRSKRLDCAWPSCAGYSLVGAVEGKSTPAAPTSSSTGGVILSTLRRNQHEAIARGRDREMRERVLETS